MPPRGLFVLGSPRSGTTLVGSLVATCAGMCDLGEYGGFYLAHSLAGRFFTRASSCVRTKYERSLASHALKFAQDQAVRCNRRWFIDSTPSNLLIAQFLPKSRSLFVLVKREHVGVVRSLGRSYRDGFKWAGPTIVDRARIWSTHYLCATMLPPDQTIVFDYDAFCKQPEASISRFKEALGKKGVSAQAMDLSPTAISHANAALRRTVGQRVGKKLILKSIPASTPPKWNVSTHRKVDKLVASTYQALNGFVRSVDGVVDSH